MSDTYTLSLAHLLALPVHPAAAAFPFISDDEIMALAQDIEANGLIHPIVLIDGEILDGRNRLQALTKTNITSVAVTDFPGGDPLDYVLSLNVHRRHLTTHDWVEVGYRLKPLVAEQARTRQLGALVQNSPASPSLSADNDGESGRTNEVVSDKLQNAVSAATLAKGWRVMEDAPEMWADARRTGTGVATVYSHMTTQPKDDRVMVEQTGRSGHTERVLVRREALLLDVLEKIADQLVDAKKAAYDFMAQANDEDATTAHRLATRIAGLAAELESDL